MKEAIERVLEEALVAELSFLDDEGRIKVHPMLPLYERGMKEIIFTSSVLFSEKVKQIKRNPKVTVFIYNEAGIRSKEVFPLLIKGNVSIDDSDVSNKWTEYLRIWKRKEPYIEALFKQRFALPLFWERIIIRVTPVKIYYWLKGDVSVAPSCIEWS